MVNVRKLGRRSALVFISVMFLGCAGTSDRNIEEARFQLDKGNYAGAETSARAALASDSENVEAKFLLASALIGESFLGQGRTYLSLIADVMRDQDAGESELETFGRITPALTLGSPEWEALNEARDTLLSIPVVSRDTNIWLQLYVTRLFEISAANALTGATSSDDECNATDDDTQTDGVPDDLNSTALDAEQSARFEDNVSNINSDGANAGLASDFALNDRFDTIASDLDGEVTAAGGNVQTGVANFFGAQFGETAAICTPK